MDSPIGIPPSVEEATAAMDLGTEVSGDDEKKVIDGEAMEEDQGEDDATDVAEDEDEDGKSLELSSASSDAEKEDTDKGISPEKADLLLIKGAGLKEEGNNEFKEGNLDKAARAYRRGVSTLKKLNKNNTGDEQVKALLVTLYTNLSTVSFKNNKYRVSAEVASQAIQIDESNVKALYRRAVANRKLGNLEVSRTDLRAAIAVDANNTACKKELVAIKKELEAAKENQKKALAKAFSNDKGGSFLYDDKEEACKRKEQEEKRKKAEEQELVKKRKVQWEDDCVKLMTNNEPAITFEEWDKQRVEREEQELKAKEKEAATRRKQERKAAKERSAAAAAATTNDNDSDDDELTESELAMMRGYKKTADGRTTSYFTRELSEDEKNRIGDMAPKRLDEIGSSRSTTTPVPNSPSSELTASATTTASAWNQAGTWEEKDTTDWCKSQLQKRLEETTVTTTTTNDDTFQVKITTVDELNGDASVAVVSGKKRYIFDFHVKLKYEIKRVNDNDDDSGAVVVAKGVVRLPDICSTHHEELEVDFDGWKKRPAPDILEAVTAVRTLLANELRAQVQQFVQDFNDMY